MPVTSPVKSPTNVPVITEPDATVIGLLISRVLFVLLNDNIAFEVSPFKINLADTASLSALTTSSSDSNLLTVCVVSI